MFLHNEFVEINYDETAVKTFFGLKKASKIYIQFATFRIFDIKANNRMK